MNYTEEQILERYRSLPEDIKDAIDSVELLDLVESVGKKFKLHVDQQGELSNEIGLLLFGITKPEVFLEEIIKRVNLTPEVAGEIAKELNTKIFFPIRASLEKLNNGGVASYRPEQATKVENFSPAGNVSRANIQTPQIPLPVPDNNAIITGSTAPHNDEAGDKKLFDEKMGKLFRLPKEEVELGSADSSSSEPAAKEKTVDPYHEPI